MWDPRSSVDLGTHDLSAHNLLVDGEKTIQLLDGRGLAGRVDDDVDAFRLLLNVVSETTLAHTSTLSTVPFSSVMTFRYFSMREST